MIIYPAGNSLPTPLTRTPETMKTQHHFKQFPIQGSIFLGLLVMALFICSTLTAQDTLTRHDSIITQFLDKTPETLEDYLYLTKSFLDKSPEKALKISLDAIEKARRVGPDGLARAYKSAGVAAFRLRRFDEARLYYDSAIQSFGLVSDSVETAKIYNNLGILYSDFGFYVKAIEFYNKALQLNTLLKNQLSIGKNNNNIGALYFKLGAYQQAAEHFTIASDIARDHNDVPSLISVKNNLGLIRHEQKRYEEAHALYQDCIALSETEGDVIGKANALLNIGNMYVEQGRADSAFFYLNQALHIFEDAGASLARTWLAIGMAHRLNNNRRQAINALMKAEDDLNVFPDKELLIKVLNELYQNWDALGNKSEAYSALQRYHVIFGEVQALFDSTAVANLEARFEVEKKMDEVAVLTHEKEIKDQLIEKKEESNRTGQILLYVSLFAVVVLLFALFLFMGLYRKHKSINALLKQQNQALEQAKNELAVSHNIITEQEERLMLLINAMPDIICFKDGFGKWVIANDSDLTLFNLKQVDYKGKTDIDLIPYNPGNEDAFRACVVSDEEAWQSRKMSRSDEVIVNAEGMERVYDVIKIPLFYPDGTRKALIVIGRDITDRKQTENQLSEALQQAEEADRLKTAFLSNMSHEIRTPLNAVIGFSELLEDETLEKEKLKIYVRHIRENGQSLLTLLGDILELSRIESGNIQLHEETFSLTSFFKSMYQDFVHQAVRKGKIHLKVKAIIPQGEWLVKTDKNRIRQLITNLFDNALKFTGEGSISYGFEFIRHGKYAGKLHLFVSDTGIGIPESKKYLLFKRFTKIHEATGMVYPGVGLGLSIVEQIVNLFNGNIEVHSEAGVGTTMNIYLPIDPIEQADSGENQAESISTSDLKGKKVLVVEDVDSNFDLLNIILNALGIQVLRATEGQQAVDICRENDDIDLVLMDIQLPGMNGYDATTEIKSLKPHLPVIAQTAFAMANEKDACFRAGCDGYIAKPIKSQLLIPVLLQVLTR